MTLQRKIKENALLSLKNHWGRALGIVLFQAGVYAVVMLIEQIFCEILDMTSQNQDFLILRQGIEIRVDNRLAVMTAAAVLIGIVILSPIGMGIKHWYYDQVTGKTPSILTIFSYFYSWKILFRVILLRMMVWIRKLLWGILFSIIPAAIGVALHFIKAEGETEIFIRFFAGIILGLISVLMMILWYYVTMRYHLTDYLFICENTLGLHEIVRISVKMMKDGKRQLFPLKLSMLPWGIFSLLAVPAMFVVPYYKASMAIFSAVRMENCKRATIEK